jgi:site-specific recombinase XerD
MFLQGFIFHLRARNLAPSTIAASAGYLGRFLDGHDPLTVTRSDIENYLAGMYQRCKPSSIWTVWRHLKSFFKWLEADGDISVNPMNGVAKPKVPLTEVTVLTPSEIRRLLNTCKQKTQEDKRDLALISIMLDTGLRLSEVTRIKLDDIGEGNAIRVFGKGRKWRTHS